MITQKKEKRKKQFLPVANIGIRTKPVQSKAANKTTRSLRSFPRACKGACQSLEMFDPWPLFKFDMSCVYQPVPGSQIVTGKAREYGKGAKEWGRRESERRTQPLLSPVSSLFCVRAFSIPSGPIISEPGTGYKSTVNAHCIFVVVRSLFLNIRLHSILNNRKKVREEEKS